MILGAGILFSILGLGGIIFAFTIGSKWEIRMFINEEIMQLFSVLFFYIGAIALLLGLVMILSFIYRGKSKHL